MDNYNKDLVWDVANEFTGQTSPITDSWNHDTLLEMKKIADACNCSLEEAAQIMIDELGFEPYDVDIARLSDGEDVDSILSACSVKSSEDEFYDEYDDESEWEEVTSKMVRDFDGFMTEYTMYVNPEGHYIFMFGDRDLYRPDDTFADWECDSEDEAYEWFDNYVGPGDEDDEDVYGDEIVSSVAITAASRVYDDLDVMLGELGRNLSAIRKNINNMVSEQDAEDLLGTLRRTNKIVSKFRTYHNL